MTNHARFRRLFAEFTRLTGRVSTRIHACGANIGAVKRHVFDAASGIKKPFVSDCLNASVPALRDRSARARAARGAAEGSARGHE